MDTKKLTVKKSVIIVLLLLLIAGGWIYRGSGSGEGRESGDKEAVQILPADKGIKNRGQIILYGEEHSVKEILEREYELWGRYYGAGMRDLFVEYPYFTAEFLNIWMQSGDDVILEEIYKDWENSAAQSPEHKAFLVKIKKNYPDTVFHGTDVGHTYAVTGERYLEYLRENGKENTEQYTLALENIEQGKCFYEYAYEHGEPDWEYRENKMTENFIREYEALDGKTVMGIYGGAHTSLDGIASYSTELPCMANQLKERYGASVRSEDLCIFAKSVSPEKTETVWIEGKEYEASYFGRKRTMTVFEEYDFIEFWRLKDAYDDMKGQELTGEVIPYSKVPVGVREEEVFVLDFIKKNASPVRKYFRSDGNARDGASVMEEFVVNE